MTTVAALLTATTLPRSEARALLAHVLDVPREQLIAHPELSVSAAVGAQFMQLAARRERGEPIAYLIGRQEFFSRSFAVSTDVLIPRPETELLVELVLQRLRTEPASRILDLGTGSGCIAITLALQRTDAQVVAVDRSAAALALAQSNAKRLGARVEFHCSDWYAQIVERFDAIVANPPYVAAGDSHLTSLRYEPYDALAAGPDGRSDLRTIVAGAHAHLNANGWLAVEHGYDQGEAVRELFRAAGFSAIETHRDAAGLERVCVGTAP